MEEVNINEIIDYSKCSMFYYLKYKKKAYTDKINLLEKYNECIHKVIYFSFCKLQEGNIIRVEDIKNTWGRLWIKDKRKSSIIFSDSYLHKDIYNNKRIKGLESLLTFREYLIKKPNFPICINQEYKFKLNDDLVIKGKFDVIRETKDEDNNIKLQTCVFKDDSEYTKMMLKNDLKFNCDAIAIENSINEDYKIEHLIYYYEKNKEIEVKNTLADKRVFAHNVNTIYNLIKNNVYYMSVNKNCQSCIYNSICFKREMYNDLLKEKRYI